MNILVSENIFMKGVIEKSNVIQVIIVIEKYIIPEINSIVKILKTSPVDQRFIYIIHINIRIKERVLNIAKILPIAKTVNI